MLSWRFLVGDGEGGMGESDVEDERLVIPASLVSKRFARDSGLAVPETWEAGDVSRSVIVSFATVAGDEFCDDLEDAASGRSPSALAAGTSEVSLFSVVSL